MNVREANVFLTRLALLDPRFGWVSEDEQVNRARVWADALADVGFDAALTAAVDHYRETRDRLMPVDVIRRCPAVVPLGEEAARARAEWLAVRGVSEAQLASMTRAQVEALVFGGQIEGR